MSGNGEAMVANKVKGIRAALYYGGHEDIVKLARQHNNANILSLGAKFMSPEEVERAVDLFIETGLKAADIRGGLTKLLKLKKLNKIIAVKL